MKLLSRSLVAARKGTTSLTNYLRPTASSNVSAQAKVRHRWWNISPRTTWVGAPWTPTPNALSRGRTLAWFLASFCRSCSIPVWPLMTSPQRRCWLPQPWMIFYDWSLAWKTILDASKLFWAVKKVPELWSYWRLGSKNFISVLVCAWIETCVFLAWRQSTTSFCMWHLMLSSSCLNVSKMVASSYWTLAYLPRKWLKMRRAAHLECHVQFMLEPLLYEWPRSGLLPWNFFGMNQKKVGQSCDLQINWKMNSSFRSACMSWMKKEPIS